MVEREMYVVTCSTYFILFIAFKYWDLAPHVTLILFDVPMARDLCNWGSLLLSLQVLNPHFPFLCSYLDHQRVAVSQIK